MNRRVLLGLVAAVAIGVFASRAGKQHDAAPVATPAQAAFTVLAGSELHELEPGLVKAARAAGVTLKLSYAGTLDIVERVNAGEHFDAILPPNGAYPALALAAPPVARDKLFYSRVAFGVKPAKLAALGWDRRNPGWADIARAAGAGKIRYAMTNPASSNTGMSALFAVASAAAGKADDLRANEIDARMLTSFLAGQKLTAGSSGWLAEAYAKDPSAVDAMVNYEAVILRGNAALAPADRLTLVYPTDGVISADYPLMLLDATRRADYDKLVATLRAPAFQRDVAAAAFLRPVLPEVAPVAALSTAPVAELGFPNRLDVIDAVLTSYQADWRRPSTSIFVLDTSGSMEGARMDAMRAALKLLAGADAGSASARYARFQSRERVVLISFSNNVSAPVRLGFDAAALDTGRQQVRGYADALAARGGTAIFSAVLAAEEIAAAEQASDPDRFVSIVLLTDGENTAGLPLAAFRERMAGRPATRVFPILFGEASVDEMTQLAALTGGRVFDGRKAALGLVFKDIRGYQ